MSSSTVSVLKRTENLHLSEKAQILLKQRRKEKSELRKSLTLFKHPIKTTKFFLIVFFRFIKSLLTYLLTHWFTLWICLPLLTAFFIAVYIQGIDSWFLVETITYIKLCVWWVGLGVLSSVGLGSGMHSGLLFLFPHFFFVCASAERCNSLNFDARTNMWNHVMQPGEFFLCDSLGEAERLNTENDAITFWGLVLKVFPYAILWGIGTALGELPPYAASYAAAKSKKSDVEFEELDRELHSGKKDTATLLKSWMMHFVEKYGSLSVVVLSCWPNVLFDVCGIVCGHFMMPFWRFFLALCLGKAILKIFLQCCFFVFLFSSKYDKIRAHLISEIGQIWPINMWIKKKFGQLEDVENFVLKEIRLLRDGVAKDKPVTKFFSLSNLFKLIIILLLAYFFIGCINQLAQSLQKEIDEEELHDFSIQLSKKDEKDNEKKIM